MEKKYIIIVIVVLALAIVGAYLYISSNQNVEIGNSNFRLPDKFHKGKTFSTNITKGINIENKNTNLKVAEFTGNTSLNKAARKFAKNKTGTEIQTTNFDVGDKNIKAKKIVRRTNVKDNKTGNNTTKMVVRYYAQKDNKTYYVQSRSNNKSIDAIVREIFTSMKKK